jgi:hypothetical protein
MKDVFWKIIAVLTLVSIITVSSIYALSTRYTVQNASFILDRWTGTVYPIKDRSKRIIEAQKILDEIEKKNQKSNLQQFQEYLQK